MSITVKQAGFGKRGAMLLLLTGLIFACTTSSWAEDGNANGMKVKDEETQLAQWFSVREAVELPYEYSLSVGQRRDDLNWSIANGDVNYASELAWSQMKIAQIRFNGRADLVGEWFVHGAYETGAIKSGVGSDSDYAGNNRTQLYARSSSKTRGATQDVTLGLGRRIRFPALSSNGMYVAPLLGISLHQQNMTMYDGVQSVPFNAPLTGLDNSYDMQWKSVWGGVDVQTVLGERIVLSAAAAYHQVNYSASANWSLRSDLAHPVSFRHVANGHGKTLQLGMGYRFNRHLKLHIGYERRLWHTDAGYDQTFFSYGGSSVYTLNGVTWDSTAIFAGLGYGF